MSPENKKTILIAEDDEVLLRALYMLFHKGKYTVASATDGESALTMIGRLKPDLILLDLLMPKMSGFDVLKNVKAEPLLKNIPVIVLSNLGDNADIEKAKSLGALDYFVKADTDLAILEKKVNEILK
jgi:CheY-like chemotaxis protein